MNNLEKATTAQKSCNEAKLPLGGANKLVLQTTPAIPILKIIYSDYYVFVILSLQLN